MLPIYMLEFFTRPTYYFVSKEQSLSFRKGPTQIPPLDSVGPDHRVARSEQCFGSGGGGESHLVVKPSRLLPWASP